MARKIERIEDLTPDPQNANKGTERGVYMLEESLRNYGAGRSILADKNGIVIAGNKTLESCASLGIPVRTVQTDGRELVVVQRTDLDIDEKAARELAYADNRASETGLQWDFEQLQADLDAGIDLSKFWQEDELKALLAQVEPEVLPGEDPGAGEIPEEPKCKAGDLWTLGKHRLLCGDSTCITDVEKVMGGEKAALCVTSPPYFNQRPEYSTFKTYDEYNDFLREILAGVISIAGDPFILAWNTGDNQADCLPMIADQTVMIHGTGITYLDTVIWVKASAVYSIPRSAHIRTNQYYYPALRWEPIIIFRKGDTMPKFDVRDVDEVSGWHQNVWEIAQVIGSEQEKVGHPAMFPLEIPYRVMKSYSKRDAVVFEPFAGSGTTMIAAEKTGRRAYGIEISPRYVSVILDRYYKMTGKEPVLEDGRTWSEVKAASA